MCGIAGLIGSSSPDLAEAMGAAMRHRGPDDEGTFIDAAAGVALVHRRLSIIDTTSAGHQPMSHAAGRFVIVFNGEIYNFRELRDELAALGHRFVSNSDTEVVLAAYAEWRERSVDRLRGMFAFAIWDREAAGPDDTALFLARDRFGIKPLYICRSAGALLFASELKALLATGLVERRLDREALWSYLSLGSIPQPRTAIAGVEMLPAGHIARVRKHGGVEIARYWDLVEASSSLRREIGSIDRTSAVARTRQLLEEATRLHMIADVPVGAFLSGGIDSTAVVGLMTRASGQRIRTFSVGFDDSGNVTDEREWARLAAKHFDSEHTEVVVTGALVSDQFDHIVSSIDQPSLDGTNTYLVSQAAGRELKVALSGLGGDELFAGYEHFRRFKRASSFNSVRHLARYVPGRFLRDRNLIAADLPSRYATLRNLAEEFEKNTILNPDLLRDMARVPLAKLYEPLLRGELDSLAQTTYVETSRYLADTLLRDADAMSMAWSLEVRPVLLDHELAQFVTALPATMKLGEINKPLLVDAVRDLLPPELLTRKKTGFELPLQHWLTGALRDRAIRAFSSRSAREVFSQSFLKGAVDALHQRRRQSIRIWAYLMLVEWLEAWDVTV
jgi:asparagine synthase (glutamine-hydrolysing)